MTEDCSSFESLLSAWLDGALTPAERARLGVHLPGCPRCRAQLDSLRVTRSLLRSSPVRVVPSDVRAVLGTTAGSSTRRLVGGPPALRVATRAAGAALAVSGFLGVTAFAVGGESEPGPGAVPVPLDVFVADHLVRTTGLPISTPAGFEVDQ